jgi:hypothetical protein
LLCKKSIHREDRLTVIVIIQQSQISNASILLT